MPDHHIFLTPSLAEVSEYRAVVGVAPVPNSCRDISCSSESLDDSRGFTQRFAAEFDVFFFK